jgi:small GTP-binding protein
MSNRCNRGFKLTFLGDSTVGKSSLVERFWRGTFNEHKESTIGAAYQQIHHNDILLNIWDTAGQERYMSLVPLYYKDADVVLLVFDLSNESSIDILEKFVTEISNRKNDIYKCIIVGNKSDLVDDVQMEILDRKVRKIVEDYPRIEVANYIYTSAKDNRNIEELLDTIVSLCNGEELTLKKETIKEQLELEAYNNSGGYYEYYSSYCPC